MQIRVFYPYFAVLGVVGVLFWYWLRHTPRRLSALRRRLLLGVRLAVLALVVAGLVRLSLTQISQRANVVFLLDLSHSVAVAARQQALDFVRAISQHKPPQDGIGLVVFGADAVVEQGVSQQFTLPEVNSQVEGTATNIARLAGHSNIAAAQRRSPTLRGKRASMHVLRHTAAMTLLQAGVDTSLIALWLSQLMVVAVYPWFVARHGRLGLGHLGLAAGGSALMLYGLYSSVVNPIGT